MSDNEIGTEELARLKKRVGLFRWIYTEEVAPIIRAYEAATARVAELECSLGFSFQAEVRQLREQLAAGAAEIVALQHDITAYRGALGYAGPSDHDGRLSDGTTPHNALCDAVQRTVAQLDAEIAALKRAGRPRCLDCIPHDGDAYTPCVRHGGCEHGFHDPSHPYFAGWDDTWEHWRARAQLAETEIARLQSIIDGLQREQAVAARDLSTQKGDE